MTTYYVNGSGAPYVGTQGTYGIGNDVTGDGSLTTPWASMDHAESQISASGDTVYVAESTYTEDNTTFHCLYTTKIADWIADGIVVVKSVSTTYVHIVAGAGITTFTGFGFDGNNDTNRIIYSNTNSSNKTYTSCSIRSAGASGYLYRRGGAGDNTNFIDCIFEDNTGVLLSVFDLSIGTNTTISGCSFDVFSVVDFFSDITATSGDVIFSNNTVNIDVADTFFRPLSNIDLTISGNTFNIEEAYTTILRLHASAGVGGAISFANNTINSDFVNVSPAIYATAGAYDVTVSGNIFNYTNVSATQNIISIVNMVDPTISNNIITTVTTNSLVHIIVQSTGTDCGTVTVSGNTLYTKSITAQCILIGTDTPGAGDNLLDGAIITSNVIYGSLYYDRTLSGIGLHAIEYGYNTGGLIRNNYINGTSFGIVIKGADEDYSDTNGIIGNVIVDCGGTSGGGSSFLRLKGVNNVPVIGNTFIFSESTYYNTNGFIQITDGDDIAHNSEGATIKNNVFKANRANHKNINVADDGSTLTNTDVDYNSHYNGTNAINNSIGAVDYISWATWQTAGYDANGIDLDSKVLESGKLKVGSPCIDTGVVIPGVNDGGELDIWGNVTDSTPNIGAYQGPGEGIDSNILGLQCKKLGITNRQVLGLGCGF